jgi:hypothetical protein
VATEGEREERGFERAGTYMLSFLWKMKYNIDDSDTMA